MKRILLLTVVIGVLLLVACGAPATEPPLFTGGPRISFEQDSVYLGEATPEEQIYYEFRFQNVGNAPLIIYNTFIEALEGC